MLLLLRCVVAEMALLRSALTMLISHGRISLFHSLIQQKVDAKTDDYSFRTELYYCFQAVKQFYKAGLPSFEIVSKLLSTKYNTGPTGLLKVNGVEVRACQLKQIYRDVASNWIRTRTGREWAQGYRRSQGTDWLELVAKMTTAGVASEYLKFPRAGGKPKHRVMNASQLPKSHSTPQKYAPSDQTPPHMMTSSAAKKRLGPMFSPRGSCNDIAGLQTVVSTPERRRAALQTALTSARRDIDQSNEFSSAMLDKRLREFNKHEEEHKENRGRGAKLDAIQALADGLSAQQVQAIFNVDGKCCAEHRRHQPYSHS